MGQDLRERIGRDALFGRARQRQTLERDLDAWRGLAYGRIEDWSLSSDIGCFLSPVPAGLVRDRVY